MMGLAIASPMGYNNNAAALAPPQWWWGLKQQPIRPMAQQVRLAIGLYSTPKYSGNATPMQAPHPLPVGYSWGQLGTVGNTTDWARGVALSLAFPQVLEVRVTICHPYRLGDVALSLAFAQVIQRAVSLWAKSQCGQVDRTGGLRR